MKRTTIGVVGAGVIATGVHLPILAAMDDVDVAWIADANSDVARKVAELHGVKAAALDASFSQLTPVDVVLLAIPLPPRPAYLDHYRGSSTALLIEKPLANDAEEHRRIVESFPAWQVSVGFQRRFYSTSAVLRSVIESGTFGPLRRIRVSEGGRTTRTEGAGQYQSLPVRAGGGIVKNLGCHALDLACWLVSASAFHVRSREVAWDGETDQRCVAKIELVSGSGQNVELDFALSWIDRMENRIEYQFEGGILSVPIAPAESIDLASPAGNHLARLSTVGAGRATTPRQAYALEWRAVLDAVSTRSPQAISAASTLLCAELVDALLARDPVMR